MKNLLLAFALLFFPLQNDLKAVGTYQLKVKAPFEMPSITVPDFKGCKTFNILDFGALPGNKELNSKAIAKAIDEANKAGGGIVVVPAGEWQTGQIHLKSNVNLHLMKGALLLFSDIPADYLPAVHSSWEGLECYNYSPLIYAYKCQNVAITGQGGIKAKMDLWKIWGARPRGHMNSLKRLYYLSVENTPAAERMMVNDSANLRPQFIQFNRSENILLEGISITNSPFWTIHLYLSKNIVVRNVKVYAHGHNNDGIDPEMSQNVLVENCVFDQGDDAIAVKSGRNPEGWRSKTPSKNIVIRNCTVKNGHQLMAIGSELSGGIENIYLNRCTVDKKAKMFNIVFIKTNERMGGYVKNIFVDDIQAAGKMEFGILGIETDVLYQWKDLVPTIERRLTPISNIHLNNVKASNVKFISRILGQKELPIENVFLKHVQADTIQGEKNILEKVKNFSFKD